MLAWAVLPLMIASCDKADTSAIEARLDAIEKVSIASLQNQVSQINTTIGNLQATQSQLSGFVTNLQTSVGTLEGNYSSLNTEVDNLGKQEAKFEKDISDLAKAVDNCGKDVKKWVEESYTTLTKFSELQEEVSTIKTNIQTICSRLDGLNSETKRISDSLSDLSTDLNEKLGKCNNEIDGIKKDLKALQDDMDTVKAQIAAIVSSVQSVVVVPDYSDGSVKLSKVADNKIYFEVYPLTAAEEIAKVGPSSFSLDYVETLTKSAKELINLPITAVSFDGKMLLVTVDGTGLPDTIIEGTKTASARLRISDGSVTRSSEYFPIYRQESDSQIAITGECSDITQTTAKLYGWSYQDSAEGEEVEFGIEFDHRDLSIGWKVAAKEKDAENKYCCQVGGLRPDELYYYRAYTLYKGLKVYGEVKSFRTAELKVTLKTEDASNIGFQEATLNGTLSVDSDDELHKRVMFLLGESAETLNETYHNGSIYLETSLSDDGSFSISLPVPNYSKASMGNSLRSNTTYYYQAVAEVSGSGFIINYFYGEIKSFTTKGPDDISLTTGDASDILYTQATLSGSFTIEGLDPPTLANNMGVGFEYGTSAELTDEVKRTISSSCNSDGSFQRTITSLLPGTKYYYRAVFAGYEDSMVKIIKEGEVKSFTTEPYPIPQAVDMGTVVNGKNIKWASFNLGAGKPEEYGDYFAWGETAPKENYSWSTYNFRRGGTHWTNVKFSKYNTDSSYGAVDNKTVLESSDDVAIVNLGGKWRMPTDAEWTELRTKCTWTWTTNYNGTGVKGRIVTASNGNSIFLPAAGYRDDTYLDFAGSYGSYWSSSLSTDRPYSAWYVYLSSDDVLRGTYYRYYGISVRPVTE